MVKCALEHSGLLDSRLPAHEQGFARVPHKLPGYFATIAELLDFAGAPYGIVIPTVTIILIDGVLATVAAVSASQAINLMLARIRARSPHLLVGAGGVDAISHRTRSSPGHPRAPLAGVF
jgi:hypothetical protein